MKTNPAPIAEVAAAPVASVALASEVEPAPHRITGNSITGVFFMTKFWTTTNSLDTAVWYFSPEGVAYENPTGFSPAVVTGSTRGIGRAVAEEFLKLGAEVLIVSRSQDDIESEIERYKKDGYQVYGVKCDVTIGKAKGILLESKISRRG